MTTPKTTVAIERLAHGADLPLPRYESALAAGVDLRAAVAETFEIAPGGRALVPTGIRIALAPGTEAQVRARSGLAVRHGLAVVNAPGTIDADYRGEIQVCLINLGEVPVAIERGMRIAQLVVAPVLHVVWDEGGRFDETDRGEGGFGSTGEGVTGGEEVIETECGRLET